MISRAGASLYALAAASLAFAPWNETAVAIFGFARGPVLDGEYWRFLTAPLVHSSWLHLALNVIGLAALQQLFGRELRLLNWIWAYLVIAGLSGLCLLAFEGRGTWVGLSGLLHGLFAFAACLALRREPLLAVGALGVVGLKVLVEQLRGPSRLLESWLGTAVAVDAHVYGYVAGALLGVLAVAASAGAFSETSGR